MTDVTNPEARVDLYWNPKQTRFLQATEPFVNFEGGFRAGKSFALCWKLLFYCIDYPGIICALTRWTQDGLDAQLRPTWRDVCRRAGIIPTWNSNEEFDELPNGSRVYLRALKTSEDINRYSKLAGLGLAIIAIDQAEEVPEDVYRAYVPARLSQRFAADGITAVPRQVLITPNPPPIEDSWICKDWPLEGGPADHPLIQTTMYDNAAILGTEYIAMQESAYERGSPEYRRFVLGERGVVTGGDAIFGTYFDVTRHAVDVEFDPVLPLYESWDFGTRRPCVTWVQFWPGVMVVLGGVMGTNMALEEFIPLIESVRGQWFPWLNGDMLRQTCDPAGKLDNPHGSETGVQILQAYGVNPTVRKDANHPPIKDGYIQKTIGYLLRRQPDGSPCFLMNPRFLIVSRKGRKHQPVLRKAFESGWIYDPKRNYIGTTYPHLRPPAKDGFYEHPCDSLGYAVTVFAPPDPAAQVGLLRHGDAVRQAMKLLGRQGMVPAIPRGEDPETWARAILAARAKTDRERDEHRALVARQKDTIEIDHQRMMRDLRACQPGFREVRSRVGGVGLQLGRAPHIGRRAGF